MEVIAITRPSIIIAPHPRSINETFDAATWSRLHESADVRWGRDEPIPQDVLTDALSDATALAFGEWTGPIGALQAAGTELRVIFEIRGSHDHPDLDYEWCFERDIQVGSIAPAFGPVVAEMCLSLALDAARGVSRSDRGFRAGSAGPRSLGSSSPVT